MNIKTILKGSVAAAALVAVASPALADGPSMTVSGQVNKAFAYIDNGDGGRGQVVDNDISRSRLWVKYNSAVNEAVTVRGRFEMMVADNKLGSVSITDSNAHSEAAGATANGTDNGGDDAISLTEQWIAVDHKSMGTLLLGKVEEASDRAWTTGPNPAGNAVDAGSQLIGSVNLQVSGAADGVLSGSTVGQFFQAFEGSGGANLIGYTSPSFAGAKVLFTYANDGDADFGLSYGGKFGGFAVDLYGGYKNSSGASTTIDNQWSVSGGVSHDSGLSLAAGFGAEDSKASGSNDADGYWIIAGYEANLVSLGATGFSVQYLQVDEATGTKGDEGTAISVGVQQGLGKGVSAYAGYTNISVDSTATNYEDVSLFLAGMRVNF